MLERIFARAKRCLCGEPISDGFNPVGEVLKWKDELSWQFLQAVGSTSDPNQTQNRWKHPRPGRVAMWEDPFVNTFGAEWKDNLKVGLCTTNIYKILREKFVENCATRYCIRRVPKTGRDGGKFDKQIDVHEIDSPLSLRWDVQSRCSFEIVGDSLLVNLINGDFHIYDDQVAQLLKAAIDKIHFIVSAGWATFRNVTAPPARHVRRIWNTRADSLAN